MQQYALPIQELQNDLQNVCSEENDKIIAFEKNESIGCIGIVDIVNSTRIASKISGAKLSEYYELFLNSMGHIILKYDGRIVKNIGDCLLYYFDFKVENSIKNAIDCGLAMVSVSEQLNQILARKKLPSLHYRVSEDFGSVHVAKFVGTSCADLFGPTVNLCSKINHSAKPDGMVIGGDLYNLIKNKLDYQCNLSSAYNCGLVHDYPVYDINVR